MQVKHNYQCTYCMQQKTSFVFDEFSMVFAICRACYDKLVSESAFYEVQDNFCSFCGNMKEVKQIEGFDDALFFSDMFICDSCFTRINESIARQ